MFKNTQGLKIKHFATRFKQKPTAFLKNIKWENALQACAHLLLLQPTFYYCSPLSDSYHP